jgi:homoserine kinase type II
MAFYTCIDEQELSNLLTGFGIGPLSGFEGASDGIENSTYFLSTADTKWILTVFEELQAEELPFFIDLMQWLFAHDLPVAHPLTDLGGITLHSLSDKPVLLFPRLEGGHLREVGEVECGAIGNCLGRLHKLTENYPLQHPNPRGTHWMEQGMTRLHSVLSTDDQLLLTKQLDNARQLRAQALPTGIIHGDLFRDNALFTQDPDGQPVLSGIIDFYSACTDLLLLDLAITVNDWCAMPDGGLDQAKVARLVNAYIGQRPMSQAEQAAWQATLELAACRFWLSRLLDEKLPRHAGVLHAHKPSAEYLARLRYHQRVSTPI